MAGEIVAGSYNGIDLRIKIFKTTVMVETVSTKGGTFYATLNWNGQTATIPAVYLDDDRFDIDLLKMVAYTVSQKDRKEMAKFRQDQKCPELAEKKKELRECQRRQTEIINIKFQIELKRVEIEMLEAELDSREKELEHVK